MNGVLRLPVAQTYRHSSRFMRSVDLQKACVRRKRIQQMHCLPPEIISTDPAENARMISKPASHDREIRRCPAEALPARQHIPEKLPDSQYQMRLFQCRTP